MSGFKRVKFQPHVRVEKGDVVEIRNLRELGESIDSAGTFEALVTSVEPCYYSPKIQGKRTQSAPTIRYTRLDNGEKSYIGANWINRVVKPYAGPAWGPQNGFAKYRGLAQAVQTSKKGVWCESLDILILRVLAYLQLPLNGHLTDNYQRIDSLYEKQSAGFLAWADSELGMMYVRAKPFTKWVERNAYRLCETVEDLRVKDTYVQDLMDDEVENDWEDTETEYDSGESFPDAYDLYLSRLEASNTTL